MDERLDSYLTSLFPIECFFSEEISIGKVVLVRRDISCVEAGGMELDVHRFCRWHIFVDACLIIALDCCCSVKCYLLVVCVFFQSADVYWNICINVVQICLRLSSSFWISLKMALKQKLKMTLTEQEDGAYCLSWQDPTNVQVPLIYRLHSYIGRSSMWFSRVL